MGLIFKNDYAESKGNITVTGYASNPNNILNNDEYPGGHGGLNVDSYGNIKLYYTNAEHNYGRGAQLTNRFGPTQKSVIVYRSSFNFNEHNGLSIYSLGSVTLTGVDASENSIMEGVIENNHRAFEFLSHNPDYPEDKWWFNGSGVITFDLISTYFNAFIELYDKNGSFIASDDNGLGGTDARLVTPALALDDYYVIVKDADGLSGGDYELIYNTSASNDYHYFYGVYIRNDYGSGNVSIKPYKGLGLYAANNNHRGLYIDSIGTVTISRLWLLTNGGDGGFVTNTDTAGKSVSASYVYADGNGDAGFQVITHGKATVKNGTAFGNNETGLHVDAGQGTTPKPVTISKFDAGGNSGWLGIHASSLGDIYISYVTSNNHTGGTGLDINNCIDTGGGCTGTGKVVISGKGNQFNNNNDGVYITTSGSITVYNTDASDNTGHGLNIYAVYATGKLTVKNTLSKQFNNFINNGSRGIDISYSGNVEISKVDASFNNNDNIEIYNGYGSDDYVKVNNTLVNASVVSTGLDIRSNGPVTIHNVHANDNMSYGIYIDNDSAPGMEHVKISKSYATNNILNAGISVDSFGNVEINTVHAIGNGGSGLNIDNQGMGGKVTIKGSYGENVFNENNGSGVNIDAGGEVNLDRISAVRNFSHGLYVYHSPAYDGKVSGKRITLIDNGFNGMYLSTDGEVYLDKVNALYNGTSGNYDGVYIVNNNQVVTIKNSVSIGNTASGFDIDSTPSLVTLINCIYVGNNSNQSGSEPDIWIH